MKVAVIDPLNRIIMGLGKEHFKVFEDNDEQKIVHFSQNTAPISAGIILDISGSVKNDDINEAKSAIAQFLESSNPNDEYFLITFNQRTKLVRDFSQLKRSLYNDDLFQKPGGRTALYDAVYLGLYQIHEGKNEEKALILIADGKDNSSAYSLSQVREYAKESTVKIYWIGARERLGNGVEFRNVVKLTGGRAFFPNTFRDLEHYIDLISLELKNQYVLGYRPTNQARDGKWRRIKVKVEAPPKFPKLGVFAREGYYAPSK